MFAIPLNNDHFLRANEMTLSADIVEKVILHWGSKIPQAAGATFV
jgi:hypothetical protein